MQDSNLRPLAPKASALPDCANPRGGRVGSRTPACGFGDRRATVTLHTHKLFYEYTPSLSDLLLSAMHIAECTHKKSP